jgi:DNA-binding transcriptional regulator GbsR (MarR family)
MENLTLIPNNSTRYHPLRANKLSNLDLEQEILEQYYAAKEFLQSLDVYEVQPNQIAQTYAVVTNILKELTKTQTDLYSAERVKAMENALIATVKTMPQSQQEKFFTLYERNLAKC